MKSPSLRASPKPGPTVLRRMYNQSAELSGRIAAYKSERTVHEERMAAVKDAAAKAASIVAQSDAEINRLDGLIRGLSGQLAKLQARLPKNGNGKT